ncbi:hypothetical protein [Azospirillum argentinense]|uniref:tetratricopeptide repeat protein n=1 Tax=Azospirillum argentinense TaxID=2970906 RepID=UPI0032DF5E4B
MTLTHGIPLYTAERLGDDDFVEQFVARRDLLDLLLNSLRALVHEGESEHQIIIGQRGMGKSSLLRRVAIGVMRDDNLRAHLIPLRFREEQYNVIALNTFWRNCSEALAEWCDANGRAAFAERIDRALESPSQRDAETAAATFLELCRHAGGRPVLLVDNLDLILDALGGAEQWRLRHTLQMRDGPIVIGAAAQFLSQSGDREGAFYEFFHPHLLEPLSEAELMRCMHALADLRGEAGQPVKRILGREPERLRTLYALTGGNPRVLALIYQIIERSESDTIFADLEALLDQVTPFYKARVEEYATSQQRAVIDAIALNWDPITTRDIGAVTGIETTSIPSHLNRLKKDGFIQEVPTSGARSGYQIAERFLNIWYLMRHGTRRARQKLRWLTKFLARLYSPEELGRMAAEARDERSCVWHPHYREAVLAAYEEISAPSLADLSRVAPQDAAFGGPVDADAVAEASRSGLDDETAEMVASAWAAHKKHLESDPLKSLEILDDLIGRFGDDPRPELREQIAKALFSKGVRLGELERNEEAIAVYDEVVGHFGDDPQPELQKPVAWTLVDKGVRLGELGRHEEAIAVYDEVVGRFGDDPQPELQKPVAWALFHKGARFGKLGQHEEAITVYDEVVGRFGDNPQPDLRRRVVWALTNKGVCLGELGRHEEAIAVYDELIARFGSDPQPKLREGVARALTNKGVCLGELGRHEEAIAVYDELIARFGSDPQPKLWQWIARTLVNKGGRLGELGRHEEAIAVYDELIARFGSDPQPVLRDGVARALINKGIRLGKLGRHEEEIAVYDELIARFGSDPQPELRRRIAWALVNKGVRLGELGRHEEAVAIYDELIARFGSDPQPELREGVARALFNKGVRLGDLGRHEEEIAVYDELIARFGSDPQPELRRRVAWALVNKGGSLGELGRHEEAVAVYDELIARFGSNPQPELRDGVAKALINKGVRLGELGRHEEAVAAYDELIARCGDDPQPELREGVAMALINKGVRLGDLGRHEEEIAVYDELIARFGDDPQPELRRPVAWALVKKGERLDELERYEEEIAVYDELIDRFGNDLYPVLQGLANFITIKANILFDHFGNIGEAEKAYRLAFSRNADTILNTANMAWLFIMTGRIAEAEELRARLSGLAPAGLALLDAAFALAADNFGSAMERLDTALAAGLESEDGASFFDDLLRLLRLAEARGYGEKLIGWFETSGNADRYAPVHAALVAFIRGEVLLLDVNPEVRRPAQDIYNRLTAPRRAAGDRGEATSKASPSRRGGRRKAK